MSFFEPGLTRAILFRLRNSEGRRREKGVPNRGAEARSDAGGAMWTEPADSPLPAGRPRRW